MYYLIYIYIKSNEFSLENRWDTRTGLVFPIYFIMFLTVEIWHKHAIKDKSILQWINHFI